MMRALALTIAIAGCSSAPPPAAVPTGPISAIEVGAPFFVPGEVMHFEVSILGLVGVELVMVVGQPGVVDDRRVIAVRSRGQTAGLARAFKQFSEDVTTWIDLDTSAPLKRHWIEDEEGEKTTIVTTFAGRRAEHVVSYPDGSSKTRGHDLPPERVIDNQSILGVLRAWRPERGTRGYYWAITDGQLLRHEVLYRGDEVLKSAVGVNRAHRYQVEVYRLPNGDGDEARRHVDRYTLWIGADPSRRPLRMAVPHRLGRVKLELIAYERPGS